jgi:hypothetical protein
MTAGALHYDRRLRNSSDANPWSLPVAKFV